MTEALQVGNRPSSRAIGILYLLYFVAAFGGLFLLRGLVVAGDAAETAHQIASHEARFRAALAVDLLGNALYVALTACLYRLLGPVNWTVSLAAAFLSLVGCGVQVLAGVFRLAALALFTGAHPAGPLGVDQLQSLAMTGLSLHAQSFYVSLVLFGLYDALLGYLVVRSTYVPRVLGVLLLCAGVGWLAFLWPPLATTLSPVVLPLGAFAEIAFMAWLLARGVEPEKWRAAARANPERLGP